MTPDPAHSGPSPAPARTVVPAVVIGSALEWFDFYLFASMAAVVFGAVFFPAQSPVAGALAAIATFAVGFVVRPLGGLLFGLLGDRIGRKRVLAVTFLLMGVSSGLIGLIPSYATIGVLAPVLLVVLRIAQGLGAGAELGSAIAVSYEHSDAARRGRFAAWPAFGVNVGLFAASLVVTILTSLDRTWLVEWGWRVPFLASFALVAIGVWVRARMPETPEFAKVADRAAARPATTPLRDLFRGHWRGVVVVGLVTIGYLAGSYVYKTFSLTYLVQFRGVAANVGPLGVTIASAVAIVVVPFAGRLCDRFAPGTVVGAGAAGVAVLAFPFFWALDSGSPVAIIAVLVVGTGIIMPVMLAASGAYFAQQFPTEVRASGLGIGREVAGVVGGLAPLGALAVVAATPGHASWPVSLMFLAAALCIAAGVLFNQRGRMANTVAPAPSDEEGAVWTSR
ncbi:MFS transporter [Pseudonocardia phyllosphaerae]|uniref:MFS transporter n=1 Tax=Pseudonocardia phyllosphaerae TaxID=3390502 RepID=UPI00397AE27B